MKALLPDNEAQRLKTLRRYDVLDTPSEQAYDDLTLLAAQICQTPTALVSLIDEGRFGVGWRTHLGRGRHLLFHVFLLRSLRGDARVHTVTHCQ